jgi:hypothetical protein
VTITAITAQTIDGWPKRFCRNRRIRIVNQNKIPLGGLFQRDPVTSAPAPSIQKRAQHRELLSLSRRLRKQCLICGNSCRLFKLQRNAIKLDPADRPAFLQPELHLLKALGIVNSRWMPLVYTETTAF